MSPRLIDLEDVERVRGSASEPFRLNLADGDEADVAALWARADRAEMTRTRARHFGYVLQTGGLLPFLSIYENVVMSRRLLGLTCPGPALDILQFLGIAHLAGRKPASVSLGEDVERT